MYWLKAISRIIIIALFTFLPDQLAAQKDGKVKKFYAGVEMGSGWLKFAQNNLPSDYTARYALGIYGGYRPFRWLRTGINLSGWLIEPFGNFYTNPENGISISNNNVQLIILPLKQNHLFITLQGGRAVYTNHHPDKYMAKGHGIKSGLGYEFNVGRNLGCSITMNYSMGTFKDVRYPGISVVNQHYDCVELLVGITYR